MGSRLAPEKPQERIPLFAKCAESLPCATRVRGLDEDGDDIQLGYVTTGRMPACISVTLANPVNGKRNPENRQCGPDYTPYPALSPPIP